MNKNIRVKLAVSEVIGIVLLLGIAISLFTVLNFFVTSFSLNESGPLVSLSGMIDKTTMVMNIKHNKGESLEGTTKITITIGTTTYQRNIAEILNHTDNRWNFLASNTDLNPDKWDFGETVQFNFTGINITDKYVQATVIDPLKNTILVSIVFQEG
jgi:hypothetical protein